MLRVMVHANMMCQLFDAGCTGNPKVCNPENQMPMAYFHVQCKTIPCLRKILTSYIIFTTKSGKVFTPVLVQHATSV